jgi:hypothetical protein
MIKNVKSGLGSLLIYDGDWCSTIAMSSSSRSVSACFPSAINRQRSGILHELGKIMYIVLSEFDNQIVEKSDDGGLAIIFTIDTYEVLTDLEWIEEIMEECTYQEN